MVEGWDEDGRYVRVGNAWVAMVVRAEDGSIRVHLMGGATLTASKPLEDVLAGLRAERETMH